MIWRCPEDGEALDRFDGRLRCSSCQSEYPIVHGVPCFPVASTDAASSSLAEAAERLLDVRDELVVDRVAVRAEVL